MPKFTFFEHANFVGKRLHLLSSCPNLKPLLKEGNWNGISSFAFPMFGSSTDEILKVEMFEKTNYKGKMLSFTNNPLITSLENMKFIGEEMNDKISSIKIYQKGKIIERLSTGKKANTFGLGFLKNAYQSFFQGQDPKPEGTFAINRLAFNNLDVSGIIEINMVPTPVISHPSLLTGSFSFNSFNSNNKILGKLNINCTSGLFELEISVVKNNQSTVNADHYFKTNLEIVKFESDNFSNLAIVYAIIPFGVFDTSSLVPNISHEPHLDSTIQITMKLSFGPIIEK